MILFQRHKLHEKSRIKAILQKSRANETVLHENPNQILQNSTSIFFKMDQAFDSVLIFDFRLYHSATLKISPP